MCKVQIPAELAILSSEEGDVTALTPVDTFKVKVAPGLDRPANTKLVT